MPIITSRDRSVGLYARFGTFDQIIGSPMWLRRHEHLPPVRTSAVALYGRFPAQAKDSDVEMDLDRCRLLARSMGYNISEDLVFWDMMKPSNVLLPGFSNLGSAIEAGDVDVILLCSLSSLGLAGSDVQALLKKWDGLYEVRSLEPGRQRLLIRTDKERKDDPHLEVFAL